MVPSLAAVRARLYRIGLSYFPAFWSTGGKVTDLAPDFSYARVKLPLNWRTRNGMGTTFGGSMYGVVDPVYVVLLTRRLGDGYTVWDRAAEIEFRKPGRSTLYAEFHLPDGEVDEISRSLAPGESCDRVYDVDLVDADGTVHAEIEKTVYVRRDE
ncbi:DUF4442 domain-containing protein [Halorarum salinum]|uniref:DUF4442 domain-containing protein n=1 Tax=Halorarum salinum TaxID=2743089 RepID=A0A7D5QE75_9EURY|nr:DUF4442 domain-containing protein [Halobaculum salinum]QLG63820.1 DUF4442 domain-containing protein [Halobaculum salinum]